MQSKFSGCRAVRLIQPLGTGALSTIRIGKRRIVPRFALERLLAGA
jgi:hypothetical protein